MTHHPGRVAAAALIILSCLTVFSVLLARRAVLRGTGLSLGDPMPRAILEQPDGRRQSTELWRMRTTLWLLFHAECRSCRKEIRRVERTFSELPSLAENLQVVLFCLDSRAEAARFQAAFQPPFEIWQDPGGRLSREIRRMAVPVLYYFDAEGILRIIRTGGTEAPEERKFLEHLSSAPGSHAK